MYEPMPTASNKQAVVLAGGKGSRLGPYTTILPKPLLPIGDRAILDVVVHQLRDHGFTDLTFAVGYLAHLIKAVFADGSGHGVSIDFHQEEEPLGTAGPLTQIEGLDETFLFMNGDVLSTLNYRELFEAHVRSSNLMTIASHKRVVLTDYGVIHSNAGSGETARVTAYEEKPQIPYVVSMGVYVAEPEVLRYIPEGEYFDVPDLVRVLLEAGEPIGSYVYDGYWLDIGRHEDYEQAIAEYDQLMPIFFPNGNPAPGNVGVAPGGEGSRPAS